MSLDLTLHSMSMYWVDIYKIPDRDIGMQQRIWIVPRSRVLRYFKEIRNKGILYNDITSKQECICFSDADFAGNEIEETRFYFWIHYTHEWCTNSIMLTEDCDSVNYRSRVISRRQHKRLSGWGKCSQFFIKSKKRI